MSIFWLTIVVMLIIALALFLVPVMRRDKAEHTSRDALNKVFYQHRLSELEQDEEQGVVDERPQHIRELQENLLSDIPEEQQRAAQPIGRWTLVPGALLLVLVTLGFYLYSRWVKRWTTARGPCASTTNLSCAGSGSAASLWPLAACSVFSTRVIA